MEAKGTVYFNDDLKDAKESVQETLSQYEDLMTKLSEEQERNVRRTIGLKMEELRAQEAMIDESLKDWVLDRFKEKQICNGIDFVSE